jgi:predicted nuclease of predicted toxin-antitoxin system
LKILLDMNLSPDWVRLLVNAGHEAVHWVDVGPANAPDTAIMAWARDHEHVVITHDLDFGALLHATGALAPSVIQFRGQDVRPVTLGAQALMALDQAQDEIKRGALISVDVKRLRITSLPLGRH